MKISNEGLKNIISWERFRPNAYQDTTGSWAIGYGTYVYHDGRRVKKGDTITEVDALIYLIEDIQNSSSTIKKYIRVVLTQNQFDALASFQYSMGKYILSKEPRLAEHINRKRWREAAERMRIYNKEGSKVIDQLTLRRNMEADLFLKDVTFRFIIKVDGNWSRMTTLALQRHLGVKETGVIQGQTMNPVTTSIGGVEFGRGGSSAIRGLQKIIGAHVDGYMGTGTVKALQKYFGLFEDGKLAPNSAVVKALQSMLNGHQVQ